ncbi:MAG: nucleoside triphosphate pyrophosphohydrolase [Rickettsiaceae bacterium]|nr:nucleoside triphosphate pyrophosphohydrolase [Rickettsiaceae bacterium]
MTKHKFKVEKLVRDNQLEKMDKEGVEYVARFMDESEYEVRLKEKLIEEAEEVKDADSRDEILEELADVLEIVYSIGSLYDLTLEDIEKVRLDKKAKKGGFEKRIYNQDTTVSKNSRAYEYFIARPEKYPEII